MPFLKVYHAFYWLYNLKQEFTPIQKTHPLKTHFIRITMEVMGNNADKAFRPIFCTYGPLNKYYQ